MHAAFTAVSALRVSPGNLALADQFAVVFPNRCKFSASTFSNHFRPWTKAQGHVDLDAAVTAGRTHAGLWAPICKKFK